MPFECLRKFAQLELPVQVFDPREMETLALLKAAGLISVSIPPIGMQTPGRCGLMPATVLGVTAKGQHALAGGKSAVERVEADQAVKMRTVFDGLRPHSE